MTIDKVVSFFCEKKGLSVSELNDRDRNPKRWHTKFMIWFYLHHSMNVSCGTLSKIFNRNRPSIFRGIRIITEHMRFHKDVREDYLMLVKELEGMTEATPSNANMEEK